MVDRLTRWPVGQKTRGPEARLNREAARTARGAVPTSDPYSKLNSLSVDSEGGGSPARMVRTKRSRCSAQGPWVRRASTCSGVP